MNPYELMIGDKFDQVTRWKGRGRANTTTYSYFDTMFSPRFKIVFGKYTSPWWRVQVYYMQDQ